ncbi:bifunctional cytochrome P450/NADPH--P450 reductase [Actinomycetospora termitidis]|uniref:Bifunctional cytochrome P450/NADPH--P450 reductase n=1 Tax=Actinomycetospora termitidis TaxID=3053470 RepID=A0ABT7M4P0_9PSEU|nr:cytochrome P450 [Actinomycetospora sp. Odt1-22]MDL5155508.1 cytochrome P450 [Actinomycetospora sp. Odt1-22]
MAIPDRPEGARPIPGPKPLPLIGNLRDLPSGRTMQRLLELSTQYGPMFVLHAADGPRYIASGLEMIDDLCDDTRFVKYVGAGQRELRKTQSSAGLFTADSDDPMWRSAHDILLPAFSQRAIRAYVPLMVDIADQLLLKWERLNPGESIDVTGDMTRLTLDTIALCGFGYRFNSFYRDTQHPFVGAMMGALNESQARQRIPPAVVRMRRGAQRALEADMQFMQDTVQQILSERRASGEPGDDLLGHMLVGTDKEGRPLPDDNIVSQCITFLVAGHETTSGLLSFAISYLLKAPDVVARAQAEVDEVLGTDLSAAPTAAQIGKLTYVTQILEETLRLWPTAPAFTRQPLEDTTVGGFEFRAGTPIVAASIALHRNTDVWGDDAWEFDPDHFAPERREGRPPNAYKPFGSGVRACIGRQFALQEAILVLAMVLQRFELVDHADYRLRIQESLTLKPDGLTIQVRPRAGRTRGGPVTSRPEPAPVVEESAPVADRHGTPLLVLFGSNLGAAEDIATRIARDGTDRGWATMLAPLDDRVGSVRMGEASPSRADLPAEGAVVVVTASYNGLPPDNATAFCDWVRGDRADAAGVRYTVFGCGNRDWASTYQAVPTLIDDRLAAAGAERVYRRGEGDARGDFDGQFHDWYAGLWDALGTACGVAAVDAEAAGGPRLRVSLENRRGGSPVVRSFAAVPATVVVNRELTARAGTPGGRSVRHVEIALPAGTTYRAGDHLGVLPRNDVGLLNRVMARFGLDAGQYATLSAPGGAPTHLPTGEPYPLLAILAGCVELQDVATRPQITALAASMPPGPVREDLAALAGTDDGARARYREQVGRPRVTFLELVERHPEASIGFAEFLDLLPALRPRYYSISSAPSVSDEASLTVGVLDEPARSGEGRYRGTCSTHLAAAPEGGTVFCLVREPSIAFRPPENPHRPMLMVGAGTGMAPFRGFLQDRGALAARGVPIAESLLVLGCRDPEDDLLYADELARYDKDGVARLVTACSRVPGHHRYVQDALAAEADAVWALLQSDAVVYVCGNAATMAPGVRAALADVFRTRTGAGDADAEAWFAGLRAQGRYLEDIWGETAVV